MEDDDRLQAYWSLTAWQGMYRSPSARCESYRSNWKESSIIGSMQACVSEVRKEWDLTRRRASPKASSLCHASAGSLPKSWERGKEMVKSPRFDRPGLALVLQRLLASTCIGMH